MRVYLDHNATSPLKPAVRAAMAAALEIAGNPSSVHAEGRAARRVIEDARESLGLALGCLPQMIIFTSGGSEANALALRGPTVERLLVSAVEHPSVLDSAAQSGRPVTRIPVDGQGLVDLARLERLLDGPRALVSVMFANNETGVLQPLAEVARLTAAAGALLHVDAVQGFGRAPLNFGLLGCDLLTLAAHKSGGPKGIGALVVRDGLALAPLIGGGGQELRRRAGTENVPAIAGFGALAREPVSDLRALHAALEAGLGDAVILGQGAERLGNTTCFALPGTEADTLLMGFDLDGIAVSSGSACSSGKVARSHVLAAMGVAPELAGAAIRVSLGWSSGMADVERFLTVYRHLRARHAARAAA